MCDPPTFNRLQYLTKHNETVTISSFRPFFSASTCFFFQLISTKMIFTLCKVLNLTTAVPTPKRPSIRVRSLPSRALRRRGGFLVLLAVHGSGRRRRWPGKFGKFSTILFFLSLSQRTRNKRVYENWKYGRDRIAG
uniref:(northern house mosquito) hypothetical protein n=1 Tax=Culex pipiens TaxID=7175 RepID=A0A8D8DVS8_CULPI